MPNVPVTPSASYTVGADTVGGVDYQRVKLNVGISGTTSLDVGVTTPLPVTGTVAIVAGVSVTVQQGISVSVSVLPTVQTIVTVLGTVAVNVVAGAAGGGSVTTTAPGITASGQVMWIAGGQSTTVSPVFVSQINPPAAGGGSVTTTAPGITASGQVMWVAGGQSTTVSPVFVSQINPPAAGGGSVTTTAPAITATGQVMWIAGGQSTSVSPVFVSVGVVSVTGTSLNVVVSGPVSISALPVVSATGVLVSILSTVIGVVSIGHPGVAGVIASSVPATSVALGLPVWIVGGQTATGVPLLVTIASQTTVVSGVVSISVMPQVSISGIVPVVTQASVSVTGLPVWMNPTQGVTILGSIAVIQTIVTQLGTQVVSVVPGVSVVAGLSGIVVVTTAASVSVSGVPVWMNPTQGVTILGAQLVSISVSAALGTVITILGTQMVSVVPGLSVTIQQGASVTGTVLALEAGNTNIALIVTSTLVAAGGSTVLMTVYQGNTQTTAGAAFWVVPAGKQFRVNAIQAVIQNSITTTPVNARIFLMQSTAALTFTSATPIVAMVAQGIATTDVQVQAALAGLFMALPAAVTVGIGITFNTTGNIAMIAVVGYLF